MAKIKSENTSVLRFKAKKRKNQLKAALTRAVAAERRNSRESDGDGKHCCEHCEYTTDCLGRLHAHQVCHSDRRPFKCNEDDCNQAFKRQNSLQRHYKAVHLNERLFSCGICHKKFSQNQSLQDHVFIHCVDKSFRCPYEDCPKTFQTPKYLKAHLNRRHPISEDNTEEATKIMNSLELMKAEAMDQLKQTMKLREEKSGLSTNTNINNLNPIEPFKCAVDDCGYSCRLWRSLRSHYKFEHSEVYNPKTKSIEMVSNDTTIKLELKNVLNNKSIISQPKYQTIECHDSDVSVEIHMDDEFSIDDDNYQGKSDDNFSHTLSRSDNLILEKMLTNSYFFECNFTKCNYRTKSFERIADHFVVHWQQIKI